MICCDIADTYLIRDRRNVPDPGATTGRSRKLQRLIPVLTAAFLVLATGGCRAIAPDAVSVDACALAFAPHSGNESIDREIIRFQETARNAPDRARALEQLGWAFVQKARVSYDQSFYNLAEQCAICILSQRPDSAEALLLKGYALYNLHRFKDAEAIARRLVETRAAPFDFGLLGDTLMEQGLLNEAVDAYQKMIDLKPGPQAYTRVAHIRWLKGDLEGAIEMMRKAAAAMGPGDAESAAWAYTRLALYELQDGSAKNAERACEAALQLRNGYAPALVARSRVLLAQDRNAEAVQLMQQAASFNPMPENKWLFAEALRAAGRNDEASVVEEGLLQSGAGEEDPRTVALFLATCRKQPDAALKLIEQEVRARGDASTLDALAWALASAGRLSEASEAMQRALAHGTKDARLFYHAGSIAAMNGQKQEARLMLNKAAAMKQMLLPSERKDLSKTLAEL